MDPHINYSSIECNWNLEMMVFAEGGKLENPEKNSRKSNNELTRVTQVRGEESHVPLRRPNLKIISH
jgi:hypothetical protein